MKFETAVTVLEKYGFKASAHSLPYDKERMSAGTPFGTKYAIPGKKSQVWIPVGTESFYRFDFGEEGLEQTPRCVTKKWEGTGGLDPRRQPECFDWVWPAEEVHGIYAHALEFPDGLPAEPIEED